MDLELQQTNHMWSNKYILNIYFEFWSKSKQYDEFYIYKSGSPNIYQIVTSSYQNFLPEPLRVQVQRAIIADRIYMYGPHMYKTTQ